jgi:hypothetical protein
MWRGVLLLIAALGISAAAPEKSAGEPAKAEDHQQSAKPPAIPAKVTDHPSANHAEGAAERCPHTDNPSFDCNSITAQADLDQARQAKRAANLFLVELFVSFFTLCAASAAAAFAWSASRAGHDANRPWLEFEISGLLPFSISAKEAVFTLELDISNRGKSPAINMMPIMELHAFSASVKRPERAAIAQRSIERRLHAKDFRRFKMGRTIFPKEKATEKVLSDKVSEADIANARGDPPGRVIYQIGIGIRYRFGRRRFGYTINSYEVKIQTGEPNYSPNAENRIQRQHMSLADCDLGYAR